MVSVPCRHCFSSRAIGLQERNVNWSGLRNRKGHAPPLSRSCQSLGSARHVNGAITDKAAVNGAAKPGLQGAMRLPAGGAEYGHAELAAARAAYAAAKIPESATGAGCQPGIKQWQWDLFIAASGMIAACALALGIAIHPNNKTAKAAPATRDFTRNSTPAPSPAVTTRARAMNRREHLSQFLSSVIRPDESSGDVVAGLYTANTLDGARHWTGASRYHCCDDNRSRRRTEKSLRRCMRVVYEYVRTSDAKGAWYKDFWDGFRFQVIKDGSDVAL